MLRCCEVSLRAIYLMLGGACNFKCRYCLQTCMNTQQPHEPTEEVYQYIEHLIKIRPNRWEKMVLLFWGGEPLIYINIIKKVVNRLGDSVKYVLVTNGSLITKDLVDYFNDNNISVTLSNDGINTVCTRNINVLDNVKQRKLIFKINQLSIESVTSMYNYDYRALFDYIDNCFKGRNISVGVDDLKITWDMPTDIYNIPLDDYNNKLRYLAGQALKDMIDYKDTKAVGLFYPHLQKILKNEEVELPMCGSFYNYLNMDCDGNIYVCHNSNEKIGTIQDERLVLMDRYNKWLTEHLDDKCNDCEFFNLCGGSCPLEHKYRHKMCAIYKTFFAVCVDLANAYINSLEPVDWSVAE